MSIVLGIFVITLVVLLWFFWYKTWEIRTGAIVPYGHIEYGDKDRFVLSYLKRIRKQVMGHAHAYTRLVLMILIKQWIHLTQTVNTYIKKKFPHIVYMVGERHTIKHISDTTPSEFMSEMKNHKIKHEGENNIIV